MQTEPGLMRAVTHLRHPRRTITRTSRVLAPCYTRLASTRLRDMLSVCDTLHQSDSSGFSLLVRTLVLSFRVRRDGSVLLSWLPQSHQSGPRSRACSLLFRSRAYASVISRLMQRVCNLPKESVVTDAFVYDLAQSSSTRPELMHIQSASSSGLLRILRE
ncbi:hypothetical protein FA95DRAFT_487121 [Auriscalpium vulgare]|uniref:Uncharacterized protein n=1 Tax=Auriscalpium vulgare TaxID=40419 RepID=A0ACB8SC49_9AGAM|nr:hypothetical protein FA95DRAFT_487121 [Auriscalpium vulgare]